MICKIILIYCIIILTTQYQLNDNEIDFEEIEKRRT